MTYGKGKGIVGGDFTDVVISTGMERGGGMELVLALSCDAIIALGGGSGTLNEIAVAYQADIPVVVLEGTGGWSGKLKGTFLDERKRYVIRSAKAPEDAVRIAVELAKETAKKYG